MPAREEPRSTGAYETSRNEPFRARPTIEPHAPVAPAEVPLTCNADAL